MDKISKIEIRNFQSLRYVSLGIGDITTIVGPSDSGKSGFIRAIRAAVENRRGDDFVSHGESEMSVELWDQGGDGVRWGKRGGSAYYVVERDHHAEKFQKLHGTVPDEVQRFLGIVPIGQDRDVVTLQFSTQYDAPFLVDKSGSLGASRFVVGFSGYDVFITASAAAKREIDDVRRAITAKQHDIVTLENQQARYPDVLDIKDRLAELRPVVSRLENLDAGRDAACSMVDRYRVLFLQVSGSRPVLDEAGSRLPALARDLPRYQQDAQDIDRARAMVELYRSGQEEVDRLTRGVEVLVTEDQGVADKVRSAWAVAQKRREVDDFVFRHDPVRREIDDLGRQIRINEFDYEDVLREFESLGPERSRYCPYYDQEVPEGVQYGCPIPRR
jgi:hypothetical protein